MSKELDRLPTTTLTKIDSSTKKGGCISEAFDMLRSNESIGAVYYVWIPDRTNEGVSWSHAYYLKDVKSKDELALNCSDNGFEGYPSLTVQQVLDHGIRLSDPSAPEVRTILNILDVLANQNNLDVYLKIPIGN